MSDTFSLISHDDLDKKVEIIRSEKKVQNMMKYVARVDKEFGLVSCIKCDVDTLMKAVVSVGDKNMAALSGVIHLRTAELMIENEFSKDSINLEIDKSLALLDYADLGAKSPYLFQASALKRKTNRAQYLRICAYSVTILIFLMIITYGLRLFHEGRLFDLL